MSVNMWRCCAPPNRSGPKDGRVQYGGVQVDGGSHGCIQHSLINKLDQSTVFENRGSDLQHIFINLKTSTYSVTICILPLKNLQNH